jgi:hypothetical protein
MLGIGLGVTAIQRGYDLANGVPAEIVGDFKNGIYEIDSVAQSGPLDLFSDDADTSGYHFDITKIVPGTGLQAIGDDAGGANTSPILKPTLAEVFLIGEGATFAATLAGSDAVFQFEFFDNPMFNTDWYVHIANNGSISYNNGTTNGNDPAGDLSVSLSRIVVNATPTGFQISVNGRAAFGFTKAAPSPAFDAVAFRCIGGAVEQITVHELQDVADLPMLSSLD